MSTSIARALSLTAALAVAGAGAAEPARISVDSPSMLEGNGPDPLTLEFTVTRSGETGSTVTLGYRTDDDTAIAPGDYTAIPRSTITFAAGLTRVTVPVTIHGDGVDEPDETLFLRLTDIVSVLDAPVSYAAAHDFDMGSTPVSVAAADVNGDGRPDLLAANSDNVAVRLNTTAPGASIPSYASAKTFGGGSGPAAVIATEVNGDGRLDLVVANRDGVSVRLSATAPGAGTPRYDGADSFAAGSGPRAVTAVDLNGDGRADLAVANAGGDSVSVLLNTTEPGASSSSYAAATDFAVGGGPLSVAAADLNGDGLADLAVANADSANVFVLLNTTAPNATIPTFAAPGDFSTGNGPGSVTAADFDGDGRVDLAVANAGSDTVSVLLNATAPGATIPDFAAASAFSVGNRPSSVTAADLDGDGRTDLAVANAGSDNLSVLLNTSAPGATMPTFGPAADFPAGTGPASVAVADVDSDGRADLVVANAGSDDVSVLLSRSVVFEISEGTATLRNDDSIAAARPPDSTPDPFAFTDVRHALLNSPQVSDSVTISGMRDAAPISVTGGEYSLGCASAFTTAPGSIAPGSTVCVRHISAGVQGAATHTTLTVGGVSDTFTSTTEAPQDFSQTGGALGPLEALWGLLAALGAGVRRKKIRSRGCPRERIL